MTKITDIKVHLLPVHFRTWMLIKGETDGAGLFGGRTEPLLTQAAVDPHGSIVDW